MSSLRQHYKEFVIEAHARLVGNGGYTVPSAQRRYMPVAVVRGVAPRDGDDLSGDGVADGVVIEITLNDRLDSDPYRAIRCAIGYARRVIDGIQLPEFDGTVLAPSCIPFPRTLH